MCLVGKYNVVCIFEHRQIYMSNFAIFVFLKCVGR